MATATKKTAAKTAKKSSTKKASPKKSVTKKPAAKKAATKKPAAKKTGSSKKAQNHFVGIMDPNSFSFRSAIEELFASALTEPLKWGGKQHNVATRRIMSRPYNALEAKTTCDAIMNRGAHWNPHHNSFFSIVTTDTYLLNDMVSFASIDKNCGYAQMHRLGLKIPKTWAIPQEDYSDFDKSKSVHTDLIFSEHELFDLREIGEAVGYPAYLKPQDGGGWVGVEKVTSPDELEIAYRKSGKKPMNLQEAIEYKEFVRTVGVGPQMYPMHYNAAAKFPHFRYMRNANDAIDFNFLTPAQHKEASQLCKIVNAFYNWDHNSCEVLLDKTDEMWAIDFANAYPDSMLTSLHFYFPELIKGMVKWLAYCAISDHKKPVAYTEMWDKYFAVKEKADKEKWAYSKLLSEYEKLADKHFDTKNFEKFCKESLPDFDKKALEYFESDAFDEIIVGKCKRFFKVEHEIPEMIAHYRGIHNFWCHCEREKLGL